MNLPVNKSTIGHASKMRSRAMAWQLEANWHWSIIFTDRMACLQPEFSYLEPIFKFLKTNWGWLVITQGPNGPNTGKK